MAKVFSKRQPTTQEEYVSSLDPLLRRNTGQFTNFGFDTSSNTPYLLPNAGNVAQSQGLEGGVQQPATQAFPQSQYSFTPSPYNPTQAGQSSYKTDARAFLQRISQPREPIAVQSLQDGGVLYNNGVIRYSDGSERISQDPSAYPVQTLQDGGIGYSDGSVRRPQAFAVKDLGNGKAVFNDGTVRYTSGQAQYDPNLGNVSNLQGAMFGGQYPITQAYGNYNPELEPNPSGINYGLDIGVRDQPLTLPFGGTVIQRFYDDGTRFGQTSKHLGYGNSVLVELPTGEKLRFSHLSQSDLGVGDVIQPGQVIGITGMTGNATGPHLDLEYYDSNGRIRDPETFDYAGQDGRFVGQVVSEDQLNDEERVQVEQTKQMIAQNPQAYRGFENQSNERGQILGDQDTRNPQPQAPQSEQAINQLGRDIGRGQLPDTRIAETVGSAENVLRGNMTPQQFASELPQQIQTGRENLAQGIASQGQKLNAPDVGVSELVQGEDAGISELATGRPAQGIQKATQFGENIARKNNLPALGVGEFGRGQLQAGAKELIGTAGNVAEKINPFKPEPAYASTDENQYQSVNNPQFQSKQPIGEKVNQSLIQDQIINQLGEIGRNLGINKDKIANRLGKLGKDVADGTGMLVNNTVSSLTGSTGEDQSDGGGDGEEVGTPAVFKKSSNSSKKSSSNKSSSSKSSSSKSSSSKSSSSKSSSSKSSSSSSSAPKQSKVQYQSKMQYQSKAPKQSVAPKKSTPAPKKTSVFKKAASSAKNIVKSVFSRIFRR